MTRLGLVALGVSLATALAAAQPPDADGQRAAWRYRRGVAGATAEASGFVELGVPPEVAARAQSDLRDLRLVGPDGGEVPYVVDRRVDRQATARQWSGLLVDARAERRAGSAWVVDLSEARTFDRILLDVPGQGFAKRFRVEASDDGRAWKVVREDAGIFDREWTSRIHHTAIDLGRPLRARYLRLRADDARSQPITVSGVTVSATRGVEADVWERPVVLVPLGTKEKASRYRIELPPAFPFESLRLDADDPAFSRRARVFEVRERSSRREEATLGEGILYRVKLADEALSAESLALEVQRGQGGGLVLQVEDGDSPPLRNLRGVVSSAATRLLFPALPGVLTLYYGNDATRAPVYDLESLKWRLSLNRAFSTASLGPEAENPRFRKPDPLPLAPTSGAAVEVSRWRSARPLAGVPREDIYTVTLAPEDIALLRPDLGDLRIVDESGRQVPYILEPAAAEARVDLRIETDARPRRDASVVSRYRLSVLGSSGKPVALPLAAVEIAFAEGFFSRPARLLGPPLPRSRGGEPLLFSGTLARTVATGAAQGPISLGTDGRPTSALFLEIDEGDNAPLSLREARGVVRVPRVAFKAAPGAYRLLLGNERAERPRYDIASLRQEVLSYSAMPVQASPAQPNAAFRRFAGDYFKEAPPTLVLWATLLAAVVALLLLTARILKQPPA